MFFARPDGAATTLRSTPRLANWNRSGESAAVRLVRALSHSQHLTDPQLAACTGPIALRFDVGLPRAVRLLEERDLDNYLLPLTAHLAGRSPHPVVSVWGSKRYAEETTLRIGTARPRPERADTDADGAGHVLAMTVTASAVGDLEDFRAGFHEEVHDRVAERLADAEPLPEGPLVLEAGFVVGPGRNWLDLWWATLDGLGPLLGQSPTQPAYHPRDGRIVDLGLHCSVDPDLGTDVVIGLRVRPGSLEPALPL
ncbi:hypothetical protein NUM3379_01770 [Kineococcus sp. NUM-3379]